MVRRRISFEPEDVEGHGGRWTEETAPEKGQEATIRLQDGAEVQGHLYFEREDMSGEDVEGHLRRRIELEVDDTAANMLRAATDRGEPVYVRFPDGAEVQGHVTPQEGRGMRIPPQADEDTEGHRARRQGATGDDVEGHRITPPQPNIP
jgi:hypothetical protein